MDYQDYVKMGLEGEGRLKLILCGSVEEEKDGKTGVVSVVFATEEKELAREKLQELLEESLENYYMVYSVPLDTDLTELAHYPSIEITREDLQ